MTQKNDAPGKGAAKGEGPVRLVVAYSTRAVPQDKLLALAPQFHAARNIKDTDKIRADLEAKQAAFEAEAADQPYTGTFDVVVLRDPVTKNTGQWASRDRQPFGDGTRVAVCAADWLLREFPNAWPRSSRDTSRPGVVFYGFDLRLFFKILGLENSYPGVRPTPLPLSMWYANSADHRDVLAAAMPPDYKTGTPGTMAAARVLFSAAAEPDRQVFARTVASWEGPHVNPEVDALMTVELATQMGLFQD